jgi:hypothetical protein
MQVPITIEYVYDTYSSMMYGIALEISQNEQAAAAILISAFQKIHRQKLIQQATHGTCAMLIKLTIQTAYEQIKQENRFSLKQFENTPMLHRLLCQQVSLESICQENKLTPTQVAKIIREEMHSISQSHANSVSN